MDSHIGMRIELINDVSDRAVTRRSGELTDQSALLGVLYLLHDQRVPIMALACFPCSQD
jgi:hypothetical protein